MDLKKCSIFTFRGKNSEVNSSIFQTARLVRGHGSRDLFFRALEERQREGHQHPLCGQLPTKVPRRIIVEWFSFIFNTVLFVLQQFSSCAKHVCRAFWIRKNRNWPQLYFETPRNLQVVQLVLKCNRLYV